MLSPGLNLTIGLVLVLAGAEVLVRSASRLSLIIGLSPLIVGLTIVSFGTSAPEIAIGVVAAVKHQTDVALGNVVGSNIFNVLFVLGLAAVIRPLVVRRHVVRLDVPILIGLSILVMALGLDGSIGRIDGAVFLVLLAAYGYFTFLRSRREKMAGGQSLDIAESSAAGGRRWQVVLNLALLLVSIGALGLGSQWLVAGASSIARSLGVSEFIIGITIVAVGTSLPEIATTLAAVFRHEHDIAVGNAIGSCIVNLLGVLGLMAIISGRSIAVPPNALTFDFPVMIATAVACLPIFFSDHRISRWEGALLLAYYAAYAGFLVLEATSHESVPMFSGIMLAFVIPMTVITFGIVTWRNVLAQRAREHAAE